ncbi:hypothetical protein GCM10022405_41020 [Gibbsiella dentisursi]|uniref:Uncharacterized protein n=1 Tax=Gibbsiella dentisursi TaxID=796890 RepID=A0ABP7LZN2_9GAMM
MNKLIEIGKCLVDISMIAAVEPHRHGRNPSHEGAKITLTNGVVVFEEQSSLREVKEKIQAALTGWQLVPLEPTPEMLAAAGDCEDVLWDEVEDDLFIVQHRAIYEAMLAAAPGNPE